MKLLNKFSGLVLIVPALFFACEEPTELGADLNPNNNKLEARYAELPLEVSHVKYDSIFSAYSNSNTSIYIGRLESSDFGKQNFSAYFNLFRPLNVGGLEGGELEFFSASLELVYGQAPFGNNIGAPQELKVYQLAEPIPYTDFQETGTEEEPKTLLRYAYYTKNEATVSSTLLGETSFVINSVLQEENNADSTLATKNRKVSIPLNDAFGADLLFEISRQNDASIYDQAELEKLTKGLAILAGENNTFVNNYEFANSQIKIAYREGTKTPDTLYLPLLPTVTSLASESDTTYSSLPVYFGVESDFSGTPLALASVSSNLQEFETGDDQLYYAPVLGIFPKIDYTSFQDFLAADTNNNVIINRAFLEFDNILRPSLKERLPVSVGFYPVEASNRRFTSTYTSGLERSLLSRRVQYEVDEVTIDQYQSDIVRILEQYQKYENQRYLKGIYYPESTLLDLARMSAGQDKLRLRLWYTNFSQ